MLQTMVGWSDFGSTSTRVDLVKGVYRMYDKQYYSWENFAITSTRRRYFSKEA